MKPIKTQKMGRMSSAVGGKGFGRRNVVAAGLQEGTSGEEGVVGGEAVDREDEEAEEEVVWCGHGDTTATTLLGSAGEVCVSAETMGNGGSKSLFHSGSLVP